MEAPGDHGEAAAGRSELTAAAVNDAALVVNGPKGAYILTICTNGPGGAAGWQVIARMATRIYQFEVARPA